jgi:hypothetical protein
VLCLRPKKKVKFTEVFKVTSYTLCENVILNSEGNNTNKLILRPYERLKMEEMKKNSNDSDSEHVYLDRKGLTNRDINRFKLTNSKVKFNSETT